MMTFRLRDWLPPSANPRDLEESPLVRAVIILAILFWWLGVAFLELPLLGILVAVYAFFLTFCVTLFVAAVAKVLRDQHVFDFVKRVAHS